jgi:chemotaxis protein methyltransferase CheR
VRQESLQQEPPGVGAREVEDLELDLLVEGIYRRYGNDFRDYARASLRRRVMNMVNDEGLPSISSLQEQVLHRTEAMERLLLHLSIGVTSMFRDPGFFAGLREKVVPYLHTVPFVRVWCAGCSTGEEAYSMAILLHEEGLLERSRIYATDMNAPSIEKAKAGIYPIDQIKDYTANYRAAGGKRPFSEYYTAQYDHAIIKQSLRQKIVFAQHNLAVDASFNEFNLVLCRNVMIYFNLTLQQRVHELLFNSLRRFGVLAVGRRESLRNTGHEQDYEAIDQRERIYRKRA